MGRGSKTNHRTSPVEVTRQMSIIGIRKLAKPSANNHQVSRFQRLQARETLLVVGVNKPLFGIDGKENRAVETVTLAENLGQHGAGLF